MLCRLNPVQTAITIPMNQNNSNTLTASLGVQNLTVAEEDQGQRLDNYLLSRLKGVPKTHIYKLIRKAEVRVNKKRPSADQRLQTGDLVRLPPIRVAERAPQAAVTDRMAEALSAAVLYEDDVLLLLNKPAGWAVHGGSGISLGVIEAVRQWREHASRWELVHRLDRDTSGCLMIAKKPSVMKVMQADWENVHKTYVALVAGQWSVKDKWVDAPLLKNVLQSGERMVRVSAEGKASLSEFSVVQSWEQVTQVRIKLHTGRTHQIRVHALWKKHPLLGDDKYGDHASVELSKRLGVKRLMLHAQHLAFRHPVSGESLTIEAPIAHDVLRVINQLSLKETS